MEIQDAKGITSTPVNKQVDSAWAFCYLTDNNDNVIPGHIIYVQDNETNQHHKDMWGYQYLIENSSLINGSSGSMLIDENKNLLGIMKTIDGPFNLGGADLLKSEGIFDGKKIISPKYDYLFRNKHLILD